MNEINGNHRSRHTSGIDLILRNCCSCIHLQVSELKDSYLVALYFTSTSDTTPWSFNRHKLYQLNLCFRTPCNLNTHPAASVPFLRQDCLGPPDNVPWSHFACFHKLRPHFCIQTLCGASYPSPPSSSHLSILSSQPLQIRIHPSICPESTYIRR